MKKKTLLLVAWMIAVAIGITFTLAPINFQNASSQFETMDSGIQRAVIIDQLYNEYPNDFFLDKSTEHLTAAGYKVDVYTTDEITIDFYKQLPLMNYNFIIIRAHALGDGSVEKSASIFSGEKYSQKKYIKEQFWGHIGQGVPYLIGEVPDRGGFDALLNQTYFVVGSKFVEEYMVGKFQNSTIILAGCETMKGPYLADSLLKRGASDVIGWNGLVDINDNDRVLINLLKETIANDVEMNVVVQSVMNEYEGKLINSKASLVHHSQVI